MSRLAIGVRIVGISSIWTKNDRRNTSYPALFFMVSLGNKTAARSAPSLPPACALLES